MSPADSARRAETKVDIEYLASLEEISWRQKSKALYLKEGDNNTRFFHRLAILIDVQILREVWRLRAFCMRMSLQFRIK